MQIGVGLHQVRGGGSGRQRGAWSAAVAITFHPTAQHLLAAITHTVTYCFWLQLHSYTMTLFLAAITRLHIISGCSYKVIHGSGLQLHTQLHFCLAASTRTVTHFLLLLQVHTQLRIVLGCNYTHGYTLFLAAIMHKVTLFLDAITHTHTQSDTSFMAAITQ